MNAHLVKKRYNLLEILLYFFCFFPFVTVKIVDLGTDMQPYVLVVAAVYLLTHIKGLKINVFYMFILVFSSILFLISSLSDVSIMTVFRSYYNYICLVFVALAIYKCTEKHGGFNEKLIKSFIWIWFLVAFIQMFVDRSFLSFIVSNFRTSSNRGVCSLTSEPSFYGYMCFFALIISRKFKKDRNFYSVLLMVQIVFFAQSAVSLVYLAVLIGFVGLRYVVKMGGAKSILIIAGAVIAVPIGWVLMQKFMDGSRIVNLITILLENPSALLRDQSIMDRFGDIIMSIESFLKDFGLPHGFATFLREEGRIMSGYGTLLHELGIVGLVYIFLFYKKIKLSFNVSYAMAITVVMFSAIQLGLPLFAFVLSINDNNYLNLDTSIQQYKKEQVLVA